MPNPTPGDVHVNRPLTNVMINWSARSRRYAFMSAFPIVGVDKQSDQLFEWSRADIFRDEARLRGPRSRAPLTGARLSTRSYACKVFALGEAIDDPTRANADAPLELDRGATRRCTDKLLLSLEKRWTTNFFTLGKWTGSTTGTDLVGGVDFTKFAAPSTGSPVITIKAEISELMKLGVDPATMTLTMGRVVFDVLTEHDDFLEKYNQTQPGILNEQLLAAALGIGQVVVPLTSENTAAEGKAPVMAFVQGDNMLLTWAPAAASIQEPSAGYTFAWRGLTGSQDGMRTIRYRDQPIQSDIIECEGAHDPNITAPELGVFFSDCV